jgi:hypothetical protein
MRFGQIRRRLQASSGDAGSSLVETAVSLAVLSIVMAVIFGTVLNVISASSSFKERTQEQADARLVIDAFVRDLRQAYTGKANLKSVATTSSATNIVFFSPDRGVDFHLRMITYDMTGGTLTRSISTSTNTSSTVVGTVNAWTFTGTPVAVPVLTGIKNTTLFTYKNQQDATPTASLPLAAVQIDLVIDQSPATSPTAQTYHTQVDLRVT